VTLNAIHAEANTLQLSIQTEDKVNYAIEFVGLKKGDEMASVLKRIEGKEGEFELTQDILYVRARVISNKLKTNPFHEGEFEEAWTQPVMFKQ
jgi:hypothetical protein